MSSGSAVALAVLAIDVNLRRIAFITNIGPSLNSGQRSVVVALELNQPPVSVMGVLQSSTGLMTYSLSYYYS